MAVRGEKVMIEKEMKGETIGLKTECRSEVGRNGFALFGKQTRDGQRRDNLDQHLRA